MKCSQVGVLRNAAMPALPIGVPLVPSKQKYAFARQSARW
jgi:hypothetical protein